MRHSPLTAIFNACILYLAPLCDFLIWLGLSGQFRARWSRNIHKEWKLNLLLNRPILTRAQMNGYEKLVAGLTLTDINDRHVLAAAIRYDVSVIVTFNQRNFPTNVLTSYGVESQHSDEFIKNIFDLDPTSVVAAAQRQRAGFKTSTLTSITTLKFYFEKNWFRPLRFWRLIVSFFNLKNPHVIRSNQ